MEIYWIRDGYETDHSSTSYAFYSSGRELTNEERKRVQRFSSRARATSRTVSFNYHGDVDLSTRAVNELLGKYFDMMVNESCDWWTFAIAFYEDKDLFKRLSAYECVGSDDTGIRVEMIDKKPAVYIRCRLDYEKVDFPSFDRWERETVAGSELCAIAENLLAAIKREILKGDNSALQAVKNRFEGKPQGKKLSKAARTLAGMIDVEW